MIMTARVLVVEDDVTMAEVLKAYLTRAGYQVEWSGNGAEAAQLWQRISPDVVILDIMLPGLSGLELLRRRRRTGDEACISLSARGEESDRLMGLETGADDYVVKPFSPREVVLRVEALLRRTERLAGTPLLNSIVTLGPVTIDSAAREARRSGRPMTLTMREFDFWPFRPATPARPSARRNCCGGSGVGTSGTHQR
jgi:DNA-binding response OmpR family regulator